jgi:eukaryotic-like serine/threonine-protein kinase
VIQSNSVICAQKTTGETSPTKAPGNLRRSNRTGHVAVRFRALPQVAQTRDDADLGSVVQHGTTPARRESGAARKETLADAVIQTLAAAQPYEDGFYFDNHILRGEAYIATGQAANAVAEFRNILARRSLSVASVAYPIAQPGLARALAAQHDTANARTAYQDFFALWKEADPDIPILKEAKAEYAKLQ